MSGKSLWRRKNQNSHTESFKVRTDTAHGFKNMYRLLQATKEKSHLNLRKSGREPYTTDSRPCACGKVALRVWKTEAWCKACYAAKVATGELK